jgi:hypothetical protein
MKQNSKFIKSRVKSLETIVEQTMVELIDEIIIKLDSKYVVYNQYTIERTQTGIEVFRRRDYSSRCFNQMRTAMMWIIFDYKHRFSDRDAVKTLDTQLLSIEIDKKIHGKLKIKNSDDLFLYSLFSTKLQTDKLKQRRILSEIDKYSKLANSISVQTRTKK